MKDYTEDKLIEQPAIRLFKDLGYEYIYAYNEDYGDDSLLGRQERDEVILLPRLRDAFIKLNPDVPREAISLAMEELLRDRSAMSPASANKEIYKLIRNGVKVNVQNEKGEVEDITLRVIDFDNPENNDYLLVSQFWVSGDIYTRRADLVDFINGIPLIFIELKTVYKNLEEEAYKKSLTDYKSTIPKIFWYNALIILSNGIDSKIGTITAPYEHFNEWKKINDEGEIGKVSLETIIKGTCEKKRILDIIENFILFEERQGEIRKLIAKYYQYLGTNNVIRAFRNIEQSKGKLGVFWHTQGSGKSYSMIFFSQKVLRKFEGNYTFVIVTDRDELDTQIYQRFKNCEAVTEPFVKAESAIHLRQLLQEDHRNVFTLIHKFRTEKGQMHPVSSKRKNIIVITDEAHRTQYDIFAMNMRTALPNASFIGFTATPLIEGEEKTRETFGDYVSIYNFKQSTDDRSTVPLYYENRIPELQLRNEELQKNFEEILDTAHIDERAEEKLEREFTREYHLITREDRLNKVAKDIIEHFNKRGVDYKAMVMCIDRKTAVKMCEKLKSQQGCPDVVVVMSSSQNEPENFKPHRIRMKNEDLEKKFKDPNDPLRMVIVCDMWLTGFDVECLSTIYLDKPMRNHTLVQAIARANRVFGKKKNGLIVDYIGVFRNLKRALAIYGTVSKEEEMPVKAKSELIEHLRVLMNDMNSFCKECGFELNAIVKAYDLEKLRLISEAIDRILVSEQRKLEFLSLSSKALQFFSAILPDPNAAQFIREMKVIRVLASRIRAITGEPVDTKDAKQAVEKLLNKSVDAVVRYEISDPEELKDLSEIDFEKIKAVIDRNKKHIAAERLKQKIRNKLEAMVKINPSRLTFAEKFQELISEYNEGAKRVEEFFEELISFAKELNEEEKRGLSKQLTEEELAIFDLLHKPDLKREEMERTKKVAKELLLKLKSEKLVIDWRKKQQTRADVMVTIKNLLFEELPESYETKDYSQKCSLLYRHIYDSYYGEGKSIYEMAGAVA
ncbi:type I restriction endonuclease subunit R [candidate division WOR-3 bacterium]|nr:type I restriction endonuclease subunit R [candidate division WOR-3 bacterium]